MNHLTIMYMRFWPDRHGGVEEHLWRFASRAAVHANVEVLTENRGDYAPTESPMDNLTIHRVKNNMPIIWRWPYVARLRMWMKQLAAHPPKGWIWTIEPTATMAAILSGYGNRVIYNPPSCFGTMHKVWEHQPHVDTMKIAGILRWFDQLAFTRAAKVVVASRSLGKQYTLCYGSRSNVHVVPRGADRELIAQLPPKPAARKKLGLEPNAFVIGFVGRLDPCKDIPHLINACACPGVMRPHDRVLIVGDGPDKMRIQGSIRANGLSDRVILAGSLHDPRSHGSRPTGDRASRRLEDLVHLHAGDDSTPRDGFADARA
jgi:glycosyltransferase involved in cell wall biosynthesis